MKTWTGWAMVGAAALLTACGGGDTVETDTFARAATSLMVTLMR